MIQLISAITSLGYVMTLQYLLSKKPTANSIRTKFFNDHKDFFMPSDPGPKQGRFLLASAALVIKEIAFVVGICWL